MVWDKAKSAKKKSLTKIKTTKLKLHNHSSNVQI